MQHEFCRWSEHRPVLQELKGVRFTTDCRVHLPRSKWTSKILKCLRFHAKMMKFHSGDVFWLLFGTSVFFHIPSISSGTSIRLKDEYKMPPYLGYRSTGMFLERFLYPSPSMFQLLRQVGCRFLVDGGVFFSGEITNSHTTVRLP